MNWYYFFCLFVFVFVLVLLLLAQINVQKFHLKNKTNKQKNREKIKTKANRKKCLRTKINGIINRQSEMYKIDKLLGRLTKEREYIYYQYTK